MYGGAFLYLKGIDCRYITCLNEKYDIICSLIKLILLTEVSKLLNVLGCYDYEVPETYKDYPKYNF